MYHNIALNIPKREWSCKDVCAAPLRRVFGRGGRNQNNGARNQIFLLVGKLYLLLFPSRRSTAVSWKKGHESLSKRKHRPSQHLSARKKFFFFLVTLLLPLVFFLLLELILRAADYGPNLSLFTTETVAGKEYVTMNPEVKSRYFNQVDFTPTTSPEYFLMPKPAGTFRIFCLGGSTTGGYPYWFNGSFSSFLRDRLQATFPDKAIEVVNLGMTATNSYTVLDCAQDLISYEPDLFLVYDGHNEFYGALGAASNESVGSSRWTTIAYLKLVHLRTFLLLRNGLSSLLGVFGKAEASASRAGTMMERMAEGQTIRYDDDRYRNTLDAFQGNLLALRSLAEEHSIPLLFGTQVANLKDLAPFVSGSHENWPAEKKQAFDQEFDQAELALSSARFTDARNLLAHLLSMDTLYAAAHYRLGQYFEAIGSHDSATSAYVRARDYDELRFRMSTDFNGQMVSFKKLPFVNVVDMERAFAESSPHGLIGFNLIMEHLHPNSRGYFLMAKAYAAGIREMGILASPEEWAEKDTISNSRLWESRHLTALDELLAARRTEVLTSGWPFKNQYPTVDPVDEKDTLRFIAEKATRGLWDWKRAHEAAAEYYEKRGEAKNAEQEYRTIINQIPLDVRAYLKLARIQLDLNRIGEARRTLLGSLKVEETPLACRALGDIALRSGRAADAVGHYERLSKFPQSVQERDENGYLLSLAYLQSNNPEAATTLLEKLILENPANQQTVELLKRIREVAAQQPQRN